jgi:hypothetical protein
MSISSKIVVGAALLLGAAPAGLAQNGGVPTIDVQKMCRQNDKAVRAVLEVGADFLGNCVAGEQSAREVVVKEWATYPALAKTRCVQPNAYLPSYVEWLTCLQMTRDVMKLRKEQSASMPGGTNALPKGRCPIVDVGDDGNIKSVVAC